MANSVETRVPYLDFRVIDLLSRVPARWKILGIDEKHILKRTFKRQLPQRITSREKHPYRAPIGQGLLDGSFGEHAREMLSDVSIQAAGVFSPERVSRLIRKRDKNAHFGELDDMAIAGILSTQLIHRQFMESFSSDLDGPLCEPSVFVDRRSAGSGGGNRAYAN